MFEIVYPNAVGMYELLPFIFYKVNQIDFSKIVNLFIVSLQRDIN